MAASLSRLRLVFQQNIGRKVVIRNVPSILRGHSHPEGLLRPKVHQFGGCLSFCSEKLDGQSKPPPRPKTVPKPLVTLLGPEKGSMTVVLLEEAEKIAKRRDLKLERVGNPDGKSSRATYRLLTHHSGHSGAGYHRETASGKVTRLEHKEKQLAMSSRIGAHDLESKIKQVAKWTEKRSDVRVTITGAENEAEVVLQTIENGLSSSGARILQKRYKGGHLKLTISPPKEAKKADSSIEDNIKTAE